MDTIYQDIAQRTQGNIYIGVVGPVRTGKSTLIRRMMETVVIPHISDPYLAERARDELPQSGSGKTIMTAEPKFVPEEAVEISPDGKSSLSVRLIDSVGYMVVGAVGAEEDGVPRMVTTPWADTEIPMTEAAELGTKKVMEGHCTIGLVVTTDGTVTDIPRSDYIEAENRAISDMQATQKPFLVVINTREPQGEAAQSLQGDIERRFGVHAVIADCLHLDKAGVENLFRQLLYTFPVSQVRVWLPKWMDALEPEHPVKAAFLDALRHTCEGVTALGTAEEALTGMAGQAQIAEARVKNLDLGSGIADVVIRFPEALFYEILSTKAGIPIENDKALLELLTELSGIRQEYSRIADALNAVKSTGYGVVMPTAEEMKLEPPEIIRKGSTFGVKLKAGAPSIHLIRVDIDTEINPMVGDEKQSRELIRYLQGENAEKLWGSNIFGKSVYDLIQEGLTAKLLHTPQEVKARFRGTLTRIVNDGANGLICLIL